MNEKELEFYDYVSNKLKIFGIDFFVLMSRFTCDMYAEVKTQANKEYRVPLDIIRYDKISAYKLINDILYKILYEED